MSVATASEFLTEESIQQQAKVQASDALAQQVGASSRSPGAVVVPIKITLDEKGLLPESDMPMEVATRLGTFTIPLWTTAEVMTEISTRHNAIEELPETQRPAGWNKTQWWNEVRAYLVTHGMHEGITSRELLMFWKQLWQTVRSLGKV